MLKQGNHLAFENEQGIATKNDSLGGLEYLHR